MGKMFNDKTLSLISRLPEQFVARKLNLQPPMPFNYTLSVTNRCNSRCKTCRIYEQDKQDMSFDEWGIVISGLGRSPYWVTLSGGEPFIRHDLEAIIYEIDRKCKPAIINIPTNGLCQDIASRVADVVSAIHCKLVVNVSMDHHDSVKNDEIRGVPGATRKAFKTYMELKRIQADNLTIGIHTVISRFNVTEFQSVCDGLMSLLPDQYITEIAEERNELGSVGLSITPGLDEYTQAVDYLISKTEKAKGLPGITNSFRAQYYDNVKRWLSGRRTIDCYAGRGMAHISSDGEVWACCIKAESMGNLRANGYSFPRIWGSKHAKRIREGNRKCVCPMANVAYTNLLLNPSSLAKVARHIML